MTIDNDFWAKSNFLPFYPAVYRKLKSGVPAIDVMKLTDHSSLDVTSIYVKHIDKTLCNKISKIAPNFFRSKKILFLRKF